MQSYCAFRPLICALHPIGKLAIINQIKNLERNVQQNKGLWQYLIWLWLLLLLLLMQSGFESGWKLISKLNFTECRVGQTNEAKRNHRPNRWQLINWMPSVCLIIKIASSFRIRPPKVGSLDCLFLLLLLFERVLFGYTVCCIDSTLPFVSPILKLQYHLVSTLGNLIVPGFSFLAKCSWCIFLEKHFNYAMKEALIIWVASSSARHYWKQKRRTTSKILSISVKSDNDDDDAAAAAVAQYLQSSLE